MIQDTLGKIEEKIQKASAMKEENREQLLSLVDTLKTEVGELSKTEEEDAETITGFTRVSTHEATREKQDPDLLKLSLEGLSSSVKKFEVTHPKLTDVVNSICNMLSNMGI